MIETIQSFFNRYAPRVGGMALAALLLALVILLFAPNLLTVTAYKLSMVTLATWLGYQVDRAVFPYARPHTFLEWVDKHRLDTVNGEGNEVLRNTQLATAAMLRRAIIVAAVIIAIALGA